MQRSLKCLLAASGLMLNTMAASNIKAANPAVTPSDKLEIRKVLLSETKDDSVSVDRRSVLEPALHPEAASNASWWQSAFVKIGNGWRPVEKSHLDADSPTLQQYRIQRDTAPKTPEGHMKLANWCQSQKLNDQERSHLTQVLMFSSPGLDRTSIYKRLGFRQIGNHWYSPAEVQAALMQSKTIQEQLREWGPTVERIARNWQGSAKQRKQAQSELDKIDDSAAIPSLLAASTIDESLTLAICNCLHGMSSFEASQALATLSVMSESSSVRNTAAEQLKERRADDFAPALLNAMRSPFETVRRQADVPKLIVREEADRIVAVDVLQVPPFDYVYGLHTGRFFPVPPRASGGLNNVPRLNSIEQARLDTDFLRAKADAAYELENRIEEENDRAEEYNRRASATLAVITGQQPCQNPSYWWAWWHLHTGTQPLPKRVEVVTRFMSSPPRIVGVIPSCLVAGTLVWTEQGMVAIERIQPGDRVLAKDINTGEIEYKPVLHTTERPPVAVKKFVVAGEGIIASDGHHFWVSGDGWTKTRELKSGLPIHTVSGMSRVQSIEPQTQPEPVYNLVIADFHTYFVGPAMVLSHDVIAPEPTNVKVPGLR